MPIARPANILSRTAGLALVPALVLGLAACGGDDDDSAGSGSFCDQAGDLVETFENASDPSVEDFGDAVAQMRDLDPPAEIADDWGTMVDAFAVFEGIESVEDADPEALAALDGAEVNEAGTNVDTYLTEECGL